MLEWGVGSSVAHHHMKYLCASHLCRAAAAVPARTHTHARTSTSSVNGLDHFVLAFDDDIIIGNKFTDATRLCANDTVGSIFGFWYPKMSLSMRKYWELKLFSKNDIQNIIRYNLCSFLIRVVNWRVHWPFVGGPCSARSILLENPYSSKLNVNDAWIVLALWWAFF